MVVAGYRSKQAQDLSGQGAAGQNLTAQARTAVAGVETLLTDATMAVRNRVSRDGGISAQALDREQRATHALAWLATYVEGVRQLALYADRMQAAGRFGETEDLLVRIGLGEYLAQVLGGIPMSQGEVVRPADMGVSAAQVAARAGPAVEALIASGNSAANR